MEFRLMARCRRLAHEHKRTRRVEADAAGGAGQCLHSHELRVVMAGTLDAPQTHVVVGANRDEAQQSRVRGQSGGRPSRGRVWALQGSWRQVRAGERDAVELTLHRAHDDAFVLRQRAQSEPHELAYLMRDAIGGPCVTIRGWQSVANRWRIGGNPWRSQSGEIARDTREISPRYTSSRTAGSAAPAAVNGRPSGSRSVPRAAARSMRRSRVASLCQSSTAPSSPPEANRWPSGAVVSARTAPSWA